MERLLLATASEVFNKLKRYLMIDDDISLPNVEACDYLDDEIYGSYYNGNVEVGKILIEKIRKYDIFSEEYYRNYQRLVEVLAHEMIHYIQHKYFDYDDNTYRLNWLKEFHATLGGYLLAFDYLKDSSIDGFIFDREYKYSILNILSDKRNYFQALYDGSLTFLCNLKNPEKGWYIMRRILDDFKSLNYILFESLDDEKEYELILYEIYSKWKSFVKDCRKKIIQHYNKSFCYSYPYFQL